jgi:hypothetical protein
MTSNHSAGFSIAGYDGTAVALAACSGYAVLAAVVLVLFDLPTAVRIPLALPIVLFVPGFGVVSALFPPTGSTDRLTGNESEDRHPAHGFGVGERFVLSVIASIVVVPAVALAVNPVTGIELAPVMAGVVAVTALASAVAIFRIRSTRGGLASPNGHSSLESLGVPVPALDGLTLVTGLLVAVLLFSSVGLSVTDAGQPAPETEFYVANPSEVSDPATLSDGTVEFRIAHDLEVSQQYTIVVARGNAGGSGGGSTGSLTEVSRTTTTVGPDTTESVPYRVDGSAIDGASTVALLLYTGSAPAEPTPADAHRSLRVTSDGSAD